MPSRPAPPRLVGVLLAALWVSLGGCGAPPSPGPLCDNGKRSLEKDLPVDALSWNCQKSPQQAPAQGCSSIDTVYDTEPARQICMDEPILYTHSIPNSGSYRPVRAQSGAYMYCPPQRWLNNLHHGAAVLLYHPCVPQKERVLLVALARSCLQDYVVTAHPQLRESTPVALVSWGRTLELPTAATSDTCRWLEATAKGPGIRNQTRSYNLLLELSAERVEDPAKEPRSIRRCCEKIISSPPDGATKANSDTVQSRRGVELRRRRAAFRRHQRAPVANTTEETFGFSARRNSVGSKKVENGTKEANTASHPNGFAPSDTRKNLLASGSETSEATLTSKSSQGTVSEPRKSLGLKDGGADTDNQTHKVSVKRTKLTNSVQKKGEDRKTARGEVDVKEREVEGKQKPGDVHPAETRAGAQTRERPQSGESPPDARSCDDGCKEGGKCQCPTETEMAGRATALSNGVAKTPRTDEAAWAAAALGFLLVLLTLSVLHTRLYRHWRTAPSLYWHDPRQDYDSVADVIRRRLRIAKRRRKRSRRQECVLLPSSSSSDELL